jgi:hypothetical protein
MHEVFSWVALYTAANSSIFPTFFIESNPTRADSHIETKRGIRRRSAETKQLLIHSTSSDFSTFEA